MKKTIIFIACILCAVIVSAQEQKVKQKVQIKDGSEIIGYVAVQTDGSYLVQNESGDMFFYSAAEIKKIVEIEEIKVKTSKPKAVKEPSQSSNQVNFKTKGYMGMVSATLGLDNGVSIVNGYRWSPHFYTGLETGLMGFLKGYGDIGIPLNLHLLSEFSKKRVAMFADLGAGMLLSFFDGPKPQGSLDLGIRSRSRKNPNRSTWYSLEFGLRPYTYTYTSEDYYLGSYYHSHTYVEPSISFKFSFSF